MGILASLHRKWRGHEERLAEQAYRAREELQVPDRNRARELFG